MTIDCFTICWNEADFLPKFLLHYQQFCRRIVVYDNESTDGSRAICRAAGVELVNWHTGDLQDNAAMQDIKNHCWKVSDADYVVVCDVDEIVTGLHGVAVMPGAVLRCQGFQMVGVAGRGVPSAMYSKCAVFSPKIKEINFSPGAHLCHPVGYSAITSANLALLHYSMRDEDGMVARWKLYADRMCRNDKKHGWGGQYLWDEERMRQEYRNTLAAASQLPAELLPRFGA